MWTLFSSSSCWFSIWERERGTKGGSRRGHLIVHSEIVWSWGSPPACPSAAPPSGLSPSASAPGCSRCQWSSTPARSPPASSPWCVGPSPAVHSRYFSLLNIQYIQYQQTRFGIIRWPTMETLKLLSSWLMRDLQQLSFLPELILGPLLGFLPLLQLPLHLTSWRDKCDLKNQALSWKLLLMTFSLVPR